MFRFPSRRTPLRVMAVGLFLLIVGPNSADVCAGPENFTTFGVRSELRLIDSDSYSVDRSISPQVRGVNNPFSGEPDAEFHSVAPGMSAPDTLGGGYLRINNPNQTGAYSSIFMQNLNNNGQALNYGSPTDREFAFSNINLFSNSNLLTNTNVNIGNVQYEYDIIISDLSAPGVSDDPALQGHFTFRGALGGLINTTEATISQASDTPFVEAMVNGTLVHLDFRGFTAPQLIAGNSSGLADTYTTGSLTAGITVVPEPASVILLVVGGAVLAARGLYGRRNRQVPTS